ncbi:hypothetical protein GDO78_014845 [Eleutherodactylus coqui]|uniref:Taste receptor type 2 n=1 Tax=Eleutherodactylus coqui TaxID=57060 RepID=A0A8J6E6M5_ELECQ|nr:hypothetical protein GDO78_014845 [Eleutherodactylus coqui]
MADSTEGHTCVQYLHLLVLAPIALVAGLVIHSFIISTNVTDWWKGRSVTPVDHIVTSLGISRMCAQCANTLYFFMDIFSLSRLNSHVTLVIIGSVYDLFSHADIWLTSLLSIVFCLKISNFRTRLFLYLRGMIAHRTVYLIGASVFFSTVNSMLTFLISITKVSNGATHNTTIKNLSPDCMHTNSIYHAATGAIFPFLFSCISSVLLFTSLYHHITKMKMSSNLSISLETYYSALKLVFFTFLYNTIYFISYTAGPILYYFYCVHPDWLFIVLDFIPVLHSSYLIYRTAKLRSQMSNVLQNVTDFLFQRKDKETRENIEVVVL